MKNVGQRKTANAEIERERDRLKAVEREREMAFRERRDTVWLKRSTYKGGK